MLPLPCMLVCSFVCANRTRDRGCSKHPVFPAPSLLEEGNQDANLGRNAPRDRESVFRRMGGWSEAIPIATPAGVDGYRFAPSILRTVIVRESGPRATKPLRQTARSEERRV